MPVVSERQVARSPFLEFLDAPQIGAHRVPVLDADHGYLAPGGRDGAHIIRSQSQPDALGSDLLGQAVDGVELDDRLVVGVRVAFRRQVALPHVHDEPCDIEPARFHLGQVHLGRQIHGVVLLGGEVGRVDVVVRVQGDDPFVDAARALHQFGVRVPRGSVGAVACRQQSEQQQGGTGVACGLNDVHRYVSLHRCPPVWDQDPGGSGSGIRATITRAEPGIST